MPRLRDLGEFAAIARLVAAGGARGEGVVLGPGDDAALLRPPPGLDLAVTTDAFVEGHHWRPGWITPGALGARLAAANLSDLAAMAATPRWGLVAMGLRPDREAAEADAIQRGLATALAARGASLVGGNLAAVSGEEWIALTLVGLVAPGAAWTRAGARPGDLLAVTGSPGRAGAATRLLARDSAAGESAEWRELIGAWRAPAPRVELALALAAAGGVRAAIDISDGLAGDLGHLCEASGVGAELEGAAGADPLLARAAATLGVSVESLRLGPSDDYELLLAIAPEAAEACSKLARDRGAPLTVVGRATAESGAIAIVEGGVRRGLPPEAHGWDHFGGESPQR